MSDGAPELIAYAASGSPRVPIVPQGRWRDWMNATNARMANRCLPLLMANESGWALLNPVAVEVTWDGQMHPDGVAIAYDGDGPDLVGNSFGSGIVTFKVPFLFRTPPGWNLLARGPANWPKDGVQALEGLIETDWSVATFTMNWKLTRPGHTVRFERDEPFCVVVPQRRDDLETFRPVVRDIASDPDTARQTKEWVTRREQAHIRKFLSEYSKDFEADWDAWEKDYFRGLLPDGSEAPEHQTKRRLAPFRLPEA